MDSQYRLVDCDVNSGVRVPSQFVDGVIHSEHFRRCLSVLKKITELDNLVQSSCEEEYEKSNIHVRDFMLYLAIIEIGEDEVAFRYYGQRVNTEWNAIFKEQSRDNWVKVNF